MENENKNEITGHCNICNSDIIFKWTEPEDLKLVYNMVKLMENFAKDTNRCVCSIMKIINKEA